MEKPALIGERDSPTRSTQHYLNPTLTDAEREAEERRRQLWRALFRTGCWILFVGALVVLSLWLRPHFR